VNPTLTIGCFGVGASVVAFWLVTRFRASTSQRRNGACRHRGLFVVHAPLLILVDGAVSEVGIAGILLLVILPSLTLLFRACGCLVRSLVSLTAPYGR
jgi:hypothetical protein